MDEYVLLKLVVALGVGLAIGGGLMILGIAKWGKKMIQGEQGERGTQGVQGEPGRGACPFAGDHPTLQTFMGESLADRKDMRDFLEDINGKVSRMGTGVSEMKGKLDLLLQGARVRWNSGLIPPDK